MVPESQIGVSPVPYRITAMRPELESGEIVTWRLQPLESALPRFQPGQFNVIYPPGADEFPGLIGGDPESDEVMHTLRSIKPADASARVLQVGDVIGLRGPFGSPWPIQQARGKDLVLVAGGMGLTSLRSILCHAMRHRDYFRKVYLLYGTRDPMNILYRDDVIAWERRPHLHVQVTVDRGGAAWRGNVGVVTKLVDRAPFDPAEAIAFVCGPEIMMRFSVLALQKHGVSDERIYLLMERQMKCVIDSGDKRPPNLPEAGPIFRFDQVEHFFSVREP